MSLMTYGDITPRTAGYVVAQLLTRGLPLLVFERFGQSKTLPGNSTQSMKFRRYLSLALNTTPLDEGVTPTSKKLTYEDVNVSLYQYGDIVEITDIIADTHEDPILSEATTILGEQAAQSVEALRFGVLKAGTNVFYGNGTQRTDVDSVITRDMQRKVTRALKRQNAQKFTSLIKSSPSYGTMAVSPAFWAVCHTDLESDIRNMSGFIDAKNYGSTAAVEGEIGAVEDVRYVLTNTATAWPDAGDDKTGHVTTADSKADVYPVLFFARDAYAIIALKGQFAIHPIVINPTPSKSDPLGQRGSVGWKTMQGTVILNDAWMARLEVACTA